MHVIYMSRYIPVDKLFFPASSSQHLSTSLQPPTAPHRTFPCDGSTNPTLFAIRTSLRTRASSPTSALINQAPPYDQRYSPLLRPYALHPFVSRQNTTTDSSAEDLYRFATDMKRVSRAHWIFRGIPLPLQLRHITHSRLQQIPTSPLALRPP